MGTWVEDVVQAFKNLGGVAKYSDLYREIRRLRHAPPPASYEAITRRTVEQHSSDSDVFKGIDLFYSVHGKGKGVWGLRVIPLPAPPVDREEAEERDAFEENVTTGAGYGDPETNRKVERAAVDFVKEWFRSRGWEVESVEGKKCGYDLLCSKDGEEEHVEVKGIKGTEPSFIITANEVRRAQSDPQFSICAVTSALSASRKLHRLTGEEFVSKYDMAALAFRAKRKVG